MTVESTPRPWTALLDGALRDRALGAAVAVATALSTTDFTENPAATELTLNGCLGTVIFLTALAESVDSRYADAARMLFDDAAGRIDSIDDLTCGLYSVPIGIGLVDSMVRSRLGEDSETADDEDIDTFTANLLAVDPWTGPVDLIHGIAGLGVYCLARMPRPSAHASLTRIVTHLRTTAEETLEGLTWRYVSTLGEAAAFTERRPDGTVNCGFAHGVPGIVTFLAAAHKAHVPDAGDLLLSAVEWLTAHRLAPGEPTSFPAFVIPGRPPESSRLAWCYGDPGVAVALLAAGDALGESYLIDLARTVARGCATQSPAGVADATLCHGTTGLGHIFNRLAQALGDEVLLDMARTWFQRTLDRHLRHLTVVDRSSAKRLRDHGAVLAVEPGPGLLFGASGAGLALLAAATDAAPWWDAALLVDVPTTGG